MTGLSRLLAGGVACLAIFAAAPLGAQWTDWLRSDPVPPAATARPHPAVVRVIVPEPGGSSLGSGTLVDVRGDYGLVVTNWHVVRDAAGPPTVVFPDGFRSAARVVKWDRDWDLAALAIWRPKVEPVRLADAAPRRGEPLYIAGYGSGNYRIAGGRCTQYVSPGRQHRPEMVELSVAARQGDSGGPIFNSRGELAGVLFGAGWGTTAGSYCGRVKGFLETVVPSGPPSEIDAATIVAQGPTTARPTPLAPLDASLASGRVADDVTAWRPAQGRESGYEHAADQRRGDDDGSAQPSARTGRLPSAAGLSHDSRDARYLTVPAPADKLQPPVATESITWEELFGSSANDHFKVLVVGLVMLVLILHIIRCLPSTQQ